MRSAARARFEQLLQERVEHPGRVAEVDARIEREFGCECAVWVLDLSGFTRLTIRHGILNFLATIQRMNRLARPLVARHGGTVIKQEADDLFARFADVPAAIDAAVATLQALSSANRLLPHECDLHAAIGIGYGRLLALGDEDLYGAEMNLACKLGEDLARAGEILLTPAAFARAGAHQPRCQPVGFSVGGIDLRAHSLAGATPHDGA